MVLRGISGSLVFSSHPPTSGELTSPPGEVRACVSCLHQLPPLGSTTHHASIHGLLSADEQMWQGC